ncbi:sucrase ferredoxin [Streptantibioticus ferralitis]|uniref:Sucrase ferredoxin n=1 Tax=Streptantibioticus ferralitis TaxID=236510 RepID=A0ABT5Z6B0_9ACTN|nr:sucrase ferredoxin [Streptantibioticus ferralitis]MDF2259081.1 sucrase ferredoxin [Streptantibioticus ferralitis]
MTTCATVSRDLAEPSAATAASARTWLLLEQPGPWGAKAFTSSHLDPRIGRALEAAAAGTGVRLALIRRPGRHADRHQPQRRRVFAAHTVPGACWLRTAEVADPAELLALDFGRLGRGETCDFGTPHQGEPLALVCTNAKRDRCCALLGRPLVAELAASGAGEVWEVTHLGGHRFGPTMLVLPYGYAYARLDAASAKGIVEAARDGRMVPRHCRGRSAFERPGQAAELTVRSLIGEDRAEVLTVATAEGAEGRWTVRVTHTDGRAWSALVEQVAVAPARPESCGAQPGTPTRMEVRSLHEEPHGWLPP